MPDFAAIAARLYGDTPTVTPQAAPEAEAPVPATLPAETPEEASAPSPEAPEAPETSELADGAVYIPDHIAEMRKQNRSPEDLLYGDRAAPEIAAMFRADADEVALSGISADTLAAVQVEASRMVSDLGLSSEDVSAFTTLGRALRRAPPSDETITGWQTEAHKALTDSYCEGAGKALDAAKQLAQRDPRVMQILETTGLGNHPQVILAFAKSALDQRHRGRLK